MERKIFTVAEMIFSLLIGGMLIIVFRLFDSFLLKPKRLRSKLEKQGIRGPAPSLFLGNLAEMKRINQVLKSTGKKSASLVENLHDWPSCTLPHLEQWRNQYGSVFVYSEGNIPTLCVTEPDLVKEISLCTSMDFGKPTYLTTDLVPLLGRGILTSNGPYWAYQRKIIAPEFYLQKVKGMVNMMAEFTSTMLETWKSRADQGKLEIIVDQDLRKLSADIISNICFGKSYAHGEKIFTRLHVLQRLISKSNIGVPGSRYLPNRHNREIWKLEKEINSMILEVVKQHSDDKCEKDLLQLILSAAEREGDSGKKPADVTLNKFVIDNCKNIYLAGHETIAISASWCLMTMACYPEWQALARAEVLDICGKNLPTTDMLRNLKTLTMVIQETLRLYPPVAFSSREALQVVKFKTICIPKGVNVKIPIPILHQLHDLWGPDAHQFKPDRFANGLARACQSPHTYIPFGVGTRTCLGQNLAMMELKVILSLILSNFRFTLAPTYRHSPVFGVVIQPEYGVSILLEKP